MVFHPDGAAPDQFSGPGGEPLRAGLLKAGDPSVCAPPRRRYYAGESRKGKTGGMKFTGGVQGEPTGPGMRKTARAGSGCDDWRWPGLSLEEALPDE
ncbi:MAG TPA: hypothetical protein DDZ83_00595 [Nitrospinae bacterium]|nr:hypothetical protein [Nitrospinota bacterium]